MPPWASRADTLPGGGATPAGDQGVTFAPGKAAVTLPSMFLWLSAWVSLQVTTMSLMVTVLLLWVAIDHLSPLQVHGVRRGHSSQMLETLNYSWVGGLYSFRGVERSPGLVLRNNLVLPLWHLPFPRQMLGRPQEELLEAVKLPLLLCSWWKWGLLCQQCPVNPTVLLWLPV